MGAVKADHLIAGAICFAKNTPVEMDGEPPAEYADGSLLPKRFIADGLLSNRNLSFRGGRAGASLGVSFPPRCN
jgi:hypothetical protein